MTLAGGRALKTRSRTAIAGAIALVLATSHVQAQTPLPDEREVESSVLADANQTVTGPDWQFRYEEARAKLIAGEFGDAAVRFAELERSATTEVDRALARAQRTLADEWAARNYTFARGPDLSLPLAEIRKLEDKRSTDEIVSLYANAVVYGAASGGYIFELTRPDTPAGYLMPVLALTAGSIGTVMALDRGNGFRYGVPQSIVSGTWIGLEYGIAWTLYYNAIPSKGSLESETHGSILWGASTLGAVAGGLIGTFVGTTPGRAGWVGSTTLWTGTLAALTAGAAVRFDSGQEIAAASGVGFGAGTAIGLLSAGVVSPSIGRVRWIDLSGVLGGLTTSAVYAAAASRVSDSNRGLSGIAALGATAGLVIGWLATASMPKDYPRTPESNPEGVKNAADKSLLARVHPLLLPTQSTGAMIGAGGTLD